MMDIFVDESGQFTKNNREEYFVVGSFTVGDQRRTGKAMRSWFHSRFPKKMRTQSEIKWSASGIDDALRLRTLKHIASLDVRVRFGYLQRKNIPNSYRRKGKIESGALYTNVIGKVLENYVPADDKDIRVFCDRRWLKGMTKQQFQSAIARRLLPLCAPQTAVRVEMIDSTTNTNIQIADWISGALAKHLERAPSGEAYLKVLKNNLLDSGTEFFGE